MDVSGVKSPERKVPWHYLKPCHAMRFPRRCLFLSSTTSSSRRGPSLVECRLKSWHMIDVRMRHGIEQRRTEVVGETPAEWFGALSAMKGQRGRVWIFGEHVGDQLALLGLFDRALTEEVNVTSWVITDPPTILDFDVSAVRFRAVDYANYFHSPPVRVEPYGTLHPPPSHPPQTGNGGPREPGRAGSDGRTADLLNLLAECSQSNLCGWHPTASGLAWAAYRHRFLDDPELRRQEARARGVPFVARTLPVRPLIHRDDDVLTLERECYRGGRAECFYVGRTGEPTSIVDVNSLYPYVMHNWPLPCRLIGTEMRPAVARLASLCDRWFCAAEVSLSSENRYYPLRGEDGVYYADGIFETCLCGPELHRAVVAGDVTGVGRCSWYATDFLFRPFVEWFYARKVACRHSGDENSALQAKLFLNSLYGRFGMRLLRWDDAEWLEPDKPYGRGWYHSANGSGGAPYRIMAWQSQVLVDHGEPDNSSPIIAAAITALGREYLRHIRSLAGWRESYYCNTDSLHVSGVGLSRLRRAGLLHPTRLGGLKVEASADDSVYRGLNDYAVGTKVVKAGVPAGAVQVSERTWQAETRQGLRGVLSTTPNGVTHYVVGRYVGGKRTVYGQVSPEGWVIPPSLGPEPYQVRFDWGMYRRYTLRPIGEALPPVCSTRRDTPAAVDPARRPPSPPASAAQPAPFDSVPFS